MKPGGVLGCAKVADEEGVPLRRAQDLISVAVAKVEHLIYNVERSKHQESHLMHIIDLQNINANGYV